MYRPKTWKQTFYTIYFGQAVSLLTSGFVQFAIVWWITDQTGSAALLSLASLIGFLPQGLLGPFAGVWVDRLSRKTVMIASDAFIALVSLLIVAFAAFGEVTVWLVLLVLLFRSVASAFYNPSLQACVPMIVPEDQLVRANGFSQSLQSVSMILSPALGGVLYAAFDLSVIILIDVLGAAVGITCVSLCAIPDPEKQDGAGTPRFFQEARQGFSQLYRVRPMFYLALIGAGYMIAFMPVNALFPLMCMGYFGGTAAFASIAEVAFSVGMLVGSVVIGAWGGFRNRIHTIALAVLLMGGAITLSGLLPPGGFAVFVGYTAVMGFSAPFYNTVVVAMLQQKIPPEYLGRVMSLFISMMSLAMPIGLGLSGLFGELFGVHTWFFLCGLGILFTGALFYLIPSVRRIDRME